MPSENSSREGHRQGRITKTGNAHLRRIVVESAFPDHCFLVSAFLAVAFGAAS
ncbi:transposase [Granulicella arctica]|uniref:transposase n=1 Tax=Granulicella arctica TaxID=940613 RepID=UPI0037C0F771